MKKCTSCGHDNGSKRHACVECDAQLPATVFIEAPRAKTSRSALLLSPAVEARSERFSWLVNLFQVGKASQAMVRFLDPATVAAENASHALCAWMRVHSPRTTNDQPRTPARAEMGLFSEQIVINCTPWF
jgi:hypothetical protein